MMNQLFRGLPSCTRGSNLYNVQLSNLFPISLFLAWAPFSCHGDCYCGFLPNSNCNIPIHDLHLPQDNKYSKPRTGNITHVLVHFISDAARKPQDPYNIQEIYNILLEYGASSHYMIGRNGEIYRLVNEDRVAYHAGKGDLPELPEYKDRMNEFSIGIELLATGTKQEMLPMMSAATYDLISPSDIGFTDAQYHSLNCLLDDILQRNPSIKRDRQHIIGHDEWAPGRKTDPGKLFDWSRMGFEIGGP